MSLIEVVVSSSLTLAALVLAIAFLVSSHSTVIRQEELSSANDEARAALEQLDREVRSSGFITALDGNSLLVHTQSNAPTAGQRCVRWVVEDRELRRRAWPAERPDLAGGWRVVARDIANADLATPTFVVPDLAGNRVTTGGRTVEVTILVNDDVAANPGSTVSHRQSLTGRNIAAGPPGPGVTWPPTSPPAPCEVLP